MKLYCREYSSGSAEEDKIPPIIFLHGIGFSGKTFKRVAPVISQRTRRKVYVPDCRNHGNSPWTNEIHYDLLEEDLVELMQQHGIPKAILVGNSMGGRTAMNFALKYPEKVDAIVIEDMTPRNVKSSGKNVVKMIHGFVVDMLRSFPSETNLNEIKKHLFDIVVNHLHPTLCDKDKAIKNYDPDFIPITKDRDGYRLECNIDVVLLMLEDDSLVQDLPDLNLTFEGDALFLYGSKGFFNLEKDPSVKKLFSKATIKRVEDASHCIHIDSPEIYTDLVSDFILSKNLSHSKY